MEEDAVVSNGSISEARGKLALLADRQHLCKA
jgi:hypothetical protein